MQLLQPALGLIVWTLLAFLVVFFILKKFAWPAIINGLTERQRTIEDSLASAEKIKAEMTQMKSENEALLVAAREERASMLKDARVTADKMVAEAKDKAKTEYDKILSDAQTAIELQKNAAITDVKNMIGNLVIEVAEKVIRRELVSRKDHEEYIKKMTADIRNVTDSGRN